MIICPVCHKPLLNDGKTYKCIDKHSFDIAKEGYVNLYLKKSQNSGDEKEMINARNDFLSNDFYNFLRKELNNIITSLKTQKLVDLACGEGYYTKYFEVYDKVGIDLSKSGLKIASKNDKKTSYILASIFNTPIESDSIDTVLTCFAPIAKEEIVRILKDNGHFILVRPNEKHLSELRKAIYDNPYDNEVESIEIEGLTKEKEYSISNNALLNNDQLQSLFKMTPYYHTTSDKDKEKLNSVKELSVTFDFIITIYKK